MSEWAFIVLPPLGWLCWSIGGTGFKWVRRFLYGVLAAVVLVCFGLSLSRAIGFAVLSCGVFVLGYGDAHPSWVWRWILGALYGATVWVIYPLWYAPVISAVAFAGGMWLSQRTNGPWKLVEGSTGLAHAALAVMALHRRKQRGK